jgi:hypothetical protein
MFWLLFLKIGQNFIQFCGHTVTNSHFDQLGFVGESVFTKLVRWRDLLGTKRSSLISILKNGEKKFYVISTNWASVIKLFTAVNYDFSS